MTPEYPAGQTQLKLSLTLKQTPPLEHGLNSQVPDAAGVVVGCGVVVVVVVVDVVEGVVATVITMDGMHG